MNIVDENEFINACNEMNKVIDTTSLVVNGASSITVPSDFSGASSVTTVVNSINTSLKPKIDEYISTFTGLQSNVEALKTLEANALAYSQEVNGSIVTNSSGEIIGIRNSSGQIISLDSFKKIESANGTYYQWTGGKGTGITNACDIYVPKIDKLQGVLIYFSAYGMEGNLSADANIRKFKEGKISTTGVVIIPTNYSGIYNFSKSQSISYAKDAQNIAESFGIDTDNINVFGWSQAGNYVGDLVKNNPEGTFKNAIFSSTRYGISDVTDPNVKVIALIGEDDGSNGVAVTETIDEYKSTHTNEVELYTVPTSSEYPRVGHWVVTGAAASSTIFNGQGIFEYGIANGGSGSSTVSVDYDESEYEDADVSETISTTTESDTASVAETTANSSSESDSSSTKNTASTNSTKTTASTTSSTSNNTASTSSTKATTSSSTSSNTTSVGSTKATTSTSTSSSSSSSTKASTPVSILPENKFTDEIPSITEGRLDTIEISTEHVMYELSNVKDDNYNSYIDSLKSMGYTLQSDGFTWIKNSNTLSITRTDNNLKIYLKVSSS